MLLGCLFLSSPSLVLAQPVTNIKKVVDGDFFQPDLGVFITRIVEFALIIGTIATLLYLILGAIKWITSSGDSGKVEEASKQITAAVVGLGVLAASWAIWLLVIYFFGLNRSSSLQVPNIFSGGESSSGDWWPFSSREAWEVSFKASHGGRTPSAQDVTDFRASQAYARKCNISVSDADWNYYSQHGSFPSTCP